jgi:hypothetical protein
MVGDLPHNNRTVDQFAAFAAWLAASSCFETSPRPKRSNISSKLLVL